MPFGAVLHIYCEVAGGGMSADAYHMTAPHPEGAGAIRSMREALDDASAAIDDIDYINVHGTSTPLGDIAELKALSELFGERLYDVNISSTKSMTGHLLGAAAAIEAIACVMATRARDHSADDQRRASRREDRSASEPYARPCAASPRAMAH